MRQTSGEELTTRGSVAQNLDERLDERLDETLLEVVRSAVERGAPLPALAPDGYARDHAEFEKLSNQRRLITAFLVDRLVGRVRLDDGPISVLSVGCGDGAVDVAVADALTNESPERDVRYVGVEPFAGSASAFVRGMEGLDRRNLDSAVHVTTFADAPLDERFDVITFVHSMYYVPEVSSAVVAARRLLKPGGELIVLSAPRGVLNQLVGAIAPPVEGHRQWFSDDVAAGFVAAGIDVGPVGTIDAVVDLTDASEDVLDFTVQARLTDELRPLVLAYLAEVAVSGDRLALPHPVDVYVASASD